MGKIPVTTTMADELLSQRVEKAKELLERCHNLEKSIEGVPKLKRKILAELKFLNSLPSIAGALKDTYIKSTNLSFLEAVLLTAEQEKDVTTVFRSFCFEDSNSIEHNCVVDVVSDSGCCWIKVTARNASALHRTWKGEGDFGAKDIVHQTKELQEATKQHPVNFSPPLVMLSCYNGITESLAKSLESTGICVKGKILPNPGSEASSSHVGEAFVRDSRPDTKQCNCINLDITTMIAYVSSLTNGGCGYVFKEAILTEQAKQERQNPMLPKIKEFLKGKKLFACQSAVRDFSDILKTVGGERERERARLLLDEITVVADNPSSRSSSLKPSASIKERSKVSSMCCDKNNRPSEQRNYCFLCCLLVIFGTGDSLKAITTTANVAFTRAAASQGIEFSVFIHESRALTESKECQASLMHELVQE